MGKKGRKNKKKKKETQQTPNCVSVFFIFDTSFASSFSFYLSLARSLSLSAVFQLTEHTVFISFGFFSLYISKCVRS